MRKSPIDYRTFVLASLLLTNLVPARALASAPMGPDEVVQAAMQRPEVQQRLDAQLRAARARVEDTTMHPIPTLNLSQGQVFGDINVGMLEVSASVEQRFDLSDWRSKVRDALPHQEASLRAQTVSFQLEVATSVRQAFWRIRYQQARVATVNDWIARLRQGLKSLQARQDRGDASPYHTQRVARELELASAQMARESGKLTQAWAALEKWTSWKGRPTLQGALLPERASASKPSPLMRPELQALQHQMLAMDAEAGAWGNPFLRDWTLGAGYRFAQVGPSTGHGVFLTLSLPLALWNTNLPRVERLQARKMEVSHELQLRTKLARREVKAARGRLDAAWKALDALRDPEKDAALSKLAQVAFDAGEASLTELLDAYKSETELRLARIDLKWDARLATILLDRSLGRGVPQ